jgi:hypothetical protein
MPHHTNWRDCQAWRDENLALNTTSNEASKYFDISLTQFVTAQDNPQVGGLGTSLKKMLDNDPSFVLGQCLSLACQLSYLNSSSYRSGVEAMVKCAKQQENALSARERMHVKAFEGFCVGDLQLAGESWMKIVEEYPNDMLAIAFGFQADFTRGNSQGIR